MFFPPHINMNRPWVPICAPSPPGCCYTTPLWVPRVTQPLPTGSLPYTWKCKLPCYSLHTSHLFPPPQPLCPCVSSLCLLLHCCPVNNFTGTSSLDPIYICISICYLSFSFWLTSLCIKGSRFIYLPRDSNVLLFMAE